MTLNRKILIVFADNIGLINYLSDLVRFEHILCFSKIEGSIIPEDVSIVNFQHIHIYIVFMYPLLTFKE